ncbi:MAG: 16S rRNA (cytosine(1402)-N(4))-methyltransferase RsmH [bacterium]|nr:16S rRNA (cytosine(1402)-N(4))-methyltransferase RsmH [bacterium]
MILHKSVLRDEVLDYLDVHSNHHYVDCTLGGGGHTEGILERSGPKGTVLAIDLDEETILRAHERLKKYTKRLIIHRGNFHDLEKIVQEHTIGPVSGIVYDLGLSIDLLKASGRGFSFLADEPLDMRFDIRQSLRAEEIVNYWSEKEIADTIFAYGEERFSRRISKAIVHARKMKRIDTTAYLVEIIERSVPSGYRHKRIHCATRTFQGLRIAVNDELDGLKRSLQSAVHSIQPGGRIAVISFHSLEDRIVKHYFRELAVKGLGTLIIKKPCIPSDEEIEANPASRSAKLRVIQINS